MDVAAVLFDFGNTLFAHAPLAATIAEAADRLGLALTMAEAADLAERIDALAASDAEAVHRRDLDAEVWAARWQHLYALDDIRMPGLGAAIYAAMHEPMQWLPFAATAEVLHRLRERDIAVGVISNTGWDVRTAFAAHDLDGLVASFTLSCEVGVAKPARAIFAIACARLGVEPARVLMVGDDGRADVGGIELGIRTLLLPATTPGSDNGLASVVDVALAGSARHTGAAR